MQATLLRDLEADVSMPDAFVEKQPNGKRICKAGTTINQPDSYRLVQMGVAMPADEECEKAANRTPEQLKAAQYAAERLARGIDHDDFDKYDRGIMIGYDADGNDIPGPNAHLAEVAEEAEYEDDEEEN